MTVEFVTPRSPPPTRQSFVRVGRVAMSMVISQGGSGVVEETGSCGVQPCGAGLVVAGGARLFQASSSEFVNVVRLPDNKTTLCSFDR